MPNLHFIWNLLLPKPSKSWHNNSFLGSVIVVIWRLHNVWFIKIWTTHNLALWLYEYLWIILLYGHLVCFILKLLAWEICNMKWGFAKKVKIKSQRQFIYGSNFYESDVTYMKPRWWTFPSIGQLVTIFTSQRCSKGSYGKYKANAQHFDSIFDFAQCKIGNDYAE